MPESETSRRGWEIIQNDWKHLGIIELDNWAEQVLNSDDPLRLIYEIKNKHSEIRMLKPDDVIQAVCSFFNITEQKLIAKNNRPKYTIPRQMVCGLLRFGNDPALSYQKIGFILMRNQATVLYSVRKFCDYFEVDKNYMNQVYGIMYNLRMTAEAINDIKAKIASR